MSGAELLVLIRRITAAERTLTVYALAQLAEIQRRKLYEELGFTSMFEYCVRELSYSEPNAYRRLRAVDAIRKFPETLSMIKNGDITICALALVSKQLTAANRMEVLKRIEGKSYRVVERVAAELNPKPDVRDSIRAVSIPATAASESVPAGTTAMSDIAFQAVVVAAEPSVIFPIIKDRPGTSTAASPVFSQKTKPLSPGRVKFTFTGTEELSRIVERCQEILSRKYPAGRLEDIFLEIGLDYLQRNDLGLLSPTKPKPPRLKETRTIVRWVKSVVYRRDGGRCVYLSKSGVRCDARRGLEYDHVVPWARGGRSDDPKNIRLLCRTHNVYVAKQAGLG